MTNITVHADCGNSPKKQLLKDFNVAFAEINTEFLVASIHDDITWDIVGDKEIIGRAAFIEALAAMKEWVPTSLVIHAVITHGNEGAVNGELRFANGETYGFADVYTFSNAKGTSIKSITSYVIKK